MPRSYSPPWIRLLCATIILGVTYASMSCQKSKPEPPPSKCAFDPHSTLKAREVFGQQANFEIRVNPGSPAEAILYAQHISDELGIKVDDNLDSVLKFCGYGELTGRDAEITPSDQLMKRFPGDVVAARFFAPKIIDVSDVGAPAGKKPLGWRKVVRLRVRANSLAAAKGIAAMFFKRGPTWRKILFRHVSKTRTVEYLALKTTRSC